VTGLPTSILINHRGFEFGRVMGAAEWDSPESLALMRHYLAQPTSTTSAE
jgi:hypothetical protein